MKQVIYTICVFSVLLNIGLATRYVTLGKSPMCMPTISVDDLK